MSTELGLKITILCDNAAGLKGLAGRHGFSALVETPSHRVMFDTGPPTDTALDTAAALGISLSGLDAVVISHGHYDHIGGLAALLQATGPQRVVAHPLAFRRRVARDVSGGLREIGPPVSKECYERLGARWVWTSVPLTIGEGLRVTGKVPVAGPEQSDAGLLAEDHGELMNDDFADELALVANSAQGPVVVTGCAHRGVANIAAYAKHLTGSDTIGLIVGGFHLAGRNEDSVAMVAERLNALGVKAIAPCHCTGLAAVHVFQRAFAGRVVSLGTGDILAFGSEGEVEIQASSG